MGQDVDVPALPLEEGEVGERRFRARQQNEVGIAREGPAGLDDLDRDRLLGGERIEVVEIGDPRKPRRGDRDGAGVRARALSAGMVQRDRVLGRQQACLREVWHDAQAIEPGLLGDDVQRTVEQADIAAELVDDVAFKTRPLAGRQQRVGADDAGDHAAAVDVADQDGWDVGGFGEAHIGDVGGAQVDLGRAAGAFDQDEIGLAAEPAEALEHPRQQGGLERMELARRGDGGHPALDHQLGAGIRLGFQEHRVHVGDGLDAAGARLQRLSSADLAAVGRDRGVVGHVLGLERADLEAALHIGAGEARHQQRLADIRPGPLEHQGRGAPFPTG